MDTKKQRILAGFTCTVFVIAAFFSLFFIVKEAHHDCTGEDCPICACIHQAEETLRQLGTGTSAAATASTCHFSLVMVLFSLSLLVPAVSLISQKVRMNN